MAWHLIVPGFLLTSISLLPLPVSADSVVLASKDGATVSYDQQAKTWAIGNESVRLTLGFDKAQTYRVLGLVNPVSGTSWAGSETATDTKVTLSGSSVAFGPSSGFRYDHHTAIELPTGVELQVVFLYSSGHVRATRHYACYRTAPVIELWTTLEATAGAQAMAVSDLNAWQLTVPRGTVRWVNGLDVGDADGGPFTVRRRDLGASGELEIGSSNRSSETAVPWFAVESASGDELFGGIMWAGAWLARFVSSSGGLQCTVGLASMKTTLSLDAALEAPHGFVGVASKATLSSAAGMERFIEQGVRGGRPFAPRVTYNTWFRNGVRLSEIVVENEIEHAARLGAERFVMDAGWYPGAGASDDFDFTSGLGRWAADDGRFPSGLAALGDLAHSLGMQFGIWVEPERVSLDTVFLDETVDEAWLAERDGRYDPDLSQADAVAAQICLGDAAAREWVLGQLSALIDQSHADYIKWDNNFWINCNRAGHGHGADDGNFAHISGLYALLAALHARYPDLIIENCASGGNRLDIGLMRYTDVAWMDDRSTPSAHVRHNLEGLASVFPPAYLFSFLLSDEAEPVHDGADLPLYFRSRMPGLLGLAFDDTELNDDERAVALREIGIAQSLKATQADASVSVLSSQPDIPQGSWDVVQETSASTGSAIIFAFLLDAGAGGATVHPTGLLADATYQVSSVDAGVLGTATGAELMEEGIGINAASLSAGHILVLTPVPAADPSASRAGRHK
jgi:alpha-galactosidase